MSTVPTAAQIEQYAATLRRRTAEADSRRRARHARAWAAAREAARVLREQFGAAEVWVFGSLLEADHFTERSDIDMAATGLTAATHLEALGRLLGLARDFEFDLVDLEHCPPGIRRSVIENGERL